MAETVLPPDLQSLYDRLDQPRRQAFVDELRAKSLIFGTPEPKRSELKAQLTSKGISIPIDTPTPELQAMLAAAKVGKARAVKAPSTRP